MENKNSLELLSEEIESLILEKTENFEFGGNSSDTLENLLINLESFKKPFPPFERKKYSLDISFLINDNHLFDNIPEKLINNQKGETIIDERFTVIRPEAITNYILDNDIDSVEKFYEQKLEEQIRIKEIIEENEFVDNVLYNLSYEENSFKEDYINYILDDKNKIENLNIINVKNDNGINFYPILMEEKNVNVIEKNEEEKEREYMNYLLDKNKKPLSFIYLMEKKFEEQKKLLLSNKNQKDLFPLSTYFKTNNIKINILKKEQNLTLSHLLLDLEDDSKIICFSIEKVNEDIFLYGGSNKGFIYKFDLIQNKQISKINTKENDISCIDVYDTYIVSGHKNGVIHVINNESIIDTFKDENNSSIISLKIVKINVAKSKFEIVYSNNDRQIKLIFKKKYLLYNKLKCEILLEITSPVNNIICYNPIRDLTISKKKKMKFAFVTIKNIVLMNISPILVTQEEINENVLTIIKPNDVDQNEVPQCCFCFGYLPNNNPLNNLMNNNFNNNNENNDKDNSPLLIISWGKYIRIYKVDHKKYKFNCVFVNDISIIKIASLSYSSIILIDNKFNAKNIMTYSFDSNINRTEKSVINDKFIFNSCFIGNIPSNIISYDNPAYIGDGKIPKQIERTIYSNNIISNIENNNLIIIAVNEILNLQLLDWKTIINSFIEKKEYENIFYCILTYINTYILRNNIDNEQNFFSDFKNQFCNEILFKISNSIKDKNDNEFYDLFIRELIEFILKVKCYKCLYEYFELLIKIIDINIIYENYTKYILEKKDLIPLNFYEEITENFLIGYITYYCDNNKIYEISKYLLNFPLSSLKLSKVNNLIKEKELLEPYIYSCMNLTNEEKEKLQTYDKEYFKPIDYMFNLFKNKKDDNKYEDFVINQNTNIDFMKIRNCKGYYGHKILWFCEFLIEKNIFFSDELIDENTYKEIMKKIILFLIGKDTLKLFLNFDSFSYFQIFKKFYLEEDLFKIINDEYNENEYIEFLITINRYDLQICDLTPKKYLYILIDAINEQEKNFYIKKDLYDFIGEFIQSMENKFCIDNKNILIDAAEFLINYPKEKPKSKIKDSFNCHTYINEKKFEREIMKGEDKIKTIIEESSNLSLLDDNDYYKLLESSNESPYYKVKIYLHNKLKNYKESLQLQLDNKNIDSRDLFKWIDETLQQIVLNDQKENDLEKKGFSNFKQEIMMKLKELAEINISEVSKLVDKWFSDEQDNVINLFDKSPSLQYTYVEKYLESHPVNSNNINSDELKYFIEKKIDLLIILKQEDKILNVLKNNSFICDNNLLERMKENKIIEAEIFINYILGNISSSMNLMKEGIMKYNEEFIKELIYSKFNNEKLTFLIQKNNVLINLGILLCKPNDFIKKNENWIDLLNELYNLKNKFKEIKTKEKINEEKNKKIQEMQIMIENNIQNLLITMADYIEFKEIMKILSEKFNKFGAKEFIHLIQQTFNSFKNLNYIFHLGEMLIKKRIYEEYMNFSIENVKGNGIVIDICDYCKEEIDNEIIIIFRCGHKYHKKCCAKEKLIDKKINSNKINLINKICYICKIEEMEINLYQTKEQIIINSNDEENEKSEDDNENNEEEFKKNIRKISKLNQLRKMKKHNISLMNVMNETQKYGL